VFPEGVFGTGQIGFALVWGEIDDNQTPNWQNVVDTQGAVWQNVDSAQAPNWQQIAA
jgi:hypothetical protein